MDEDKLSIFPSNKPFFAATVAVCAIACAGSAVLAQKGAPMIAIETMEIGKAPTDFDFGLTGQGRPGQWVVTRDASATGGRAIEQSSAGHILALDISCLFKSLPERAQTVRV